jgi:hypothetical protein
MTTNETTQENTMNLKSYLQELTAGEATPLPENETWEATMERMTAATEPAEIDEDTYFWFLEVLPPRFMAGSYFGFAEGAEPIRLFWKRSGRYFVRSLDWTQTKCLSRLTNSPVYG